MLACFGYAGYSAIVGNLRDVMPEEGLAAANWAVSKLIKAMGEARTIVIRLSTVKHHEKLRVLLAFMITCSWVWQCI